MNTKLLIIGIVGGVAAAVVLYAVLTREPQEASTQLSPIEAEESQGLGGQLYEKTGNPAIPESNPFQANPNLFEEAKTNPFEGGYRNPFE